ncbi:MAG: thiamine phosphate synthase [Clostridium sp.]|nr:thiamine phosphate synthase [Clostridium sp.]
MLQFILRPASGEYSLPELAQMAIEGGCLWLRFDPQGIPQADVRDALAEIMPLCKENGTILTIENDIDLAKEMGVHGVHLRSCGKSPMEVRELLGPEAIIGVEVPSAVSAIGLKSLDVDYVAFPEGWPIDKLAEKISASRGAGLELPIVAQGDFTLGEIPALLAAKASGLATSAPISQSPDPVAATAAYIAALKNQ